MMLRSLTFQELPGTDAEWTLEELPLAQVNLLVGRNATGKSRTINVIHALSTLLTGERKEVISSACFEVTFEDGDKNWNYHLEIDNGIVTREELIHNGEQVLHRSQGGISRIRAEAIDDDGDGEDGKAALIVNAPRGKSKMLRFSVPGPQVAVVSKRDDIQHPFLRPLLDWGQSVRLFQFGAEVKPSNLALAVKHVQVPFDEKQTSSLVPIYAKGFKEFGEAYPRLIITDMKALGYDLEKLEIRQPANMIINAILPGDLVGVSVRETELKCFVDQPSISQGMFRALTLLAHINYYVLGQKPACFLIDDIGEGLDFERSCSIIDLVRKKAYDFGFQVIMSTNDRFVMNRVPLEEWCLLQREGHHVRVRNYANSKPVFERFKITGLNNFDLLRTDFINKVQ
jgi:hypothetical protein